MTRTAGTLARRSRSAALMSVTVPLAVRGGPAAPVAVAAAMRGRRLGCRHRIVLVAASAAQARALILRYAGALASVVTVCVPVPVPVPRRVRPV